MQNLIPGWLRAILDSGLVMARIKAGLATGSVFVGGWVLSHMLDWLEAHATFFSHATNYTIAATVATCAAGLVAAIYGIIYPQKDVTDVDAKVKAAGITGNPACANNANIVAQVKAVAGSPAALADLKAKLLGGGV